MRHSQRTVKPALGTLSYAHSCPTFHNSDRRQSPEVPGVHSDGGKACQEPQTPRLEGLRRELVFLLVTMIAGVGYCTQPTVTFWGDVSVLLDAKEQQWVAKALPQEER